MIEENQFQLKSNKIEYDFKLYDGSLDLVEYFVKNKSSPMSISEVEEFENKYRLKLPSQLRYFITNIAHNYDITKKRNILYYLKSHNNLDECSVNDIMSEPIISQIYKTYYNIYETYGQLRLSNRYYIITNGKYENMIINKNKYIRNSNGNNFELISFKQFILNNYIPKKTWKKSIDLDYYFV